MNEIEKKALALVNEVQKVRGHIGSPWNSPTILNEALYRAIEQHEAFRQEVSDAVEMHCDAMDMFPQDTVLGRFIIAKPDPLVEAMHDCGVDRFESWADQLRAAIEARGGRIVWGEG